MSVASDENASGDGLRWLRIWASFGLAVLLLGGFAGLLRSEAVVVPDTRSYEIFQFSPVAAMAFEIRTPGYPMVLTISRGISRITAETWSWQSVAVGIAVLFHAIACTALLWELVAWRVRWLVVAGATVAVAFGCTNWNLSTTLTPDAIAMSTMVLAAVAVMRWWRSGRKRDAIWVGAMSIAAIAMKPAYLFLLPWSVLIALVVPGIVSGPGRRLIHAATMNLIPIVVLLGWVTFRYSASGDVGLLPFGHQNMAAVTTQLLSATELQSLPGGNGELGRRIANLRRDRHGVASDNGDMETIRDPGLAMRYDDSPIDEPITSFTTLETRWDKTIYEVVIPASRAMGGNVNRQHQRIGDLNRAIVRGYPMRYGRYVLLAIRRGLWGTAANIVMHPPFLLALVIAAVVCSWRVCRGAASCHSQTTLQLDITDRRRFIDGITALGFVGVSLMLSNIAFVSLSSPPIGRFADAGAALVPAWLVACGLNRWLRRVDKTWQATTTSPP